jgi:hypothetical protein
MSSDIEFLRQRLALVEQNLASPDLNHAQMGQPIPRSDLDHRRLAYQRQARLLQKLLVRARPGNVLPVLIAWRRDFGQFAKEHRTKYKDVIRAHDEWFELPLHARNHIALPPRPPAPRFVDHDGAPWIVDDAFLVVVDGLIEQLRKWLGEDTEM